MSLKPFYTLENLKNTWFTDN